MLHLLRDPQGATGDIDYARIYDRALSATEMRELFAVPEPGVASRFGLGLTALARRRRHVGAAVAGMRSTPLPL